MSQIPRRPLDESIFEAISSRAGSSIVDISTVLERVDSIERWLLTFEELDGGLQRLFDDGRIAEVDIGRFVSLASPHATRPYSGLSVGRYDEAVTAYRISFAADAEWLMRSRVMRAPVGLWRWCYRVTGGRFGLAPGSVDLGAISIVFAIERVIAPLGAVPGDLSGRGLADRPCAGGGFAGRPSGSARWCQGGDPAAQATAERRPSFS